jgi:hypothetical protein
MHPSTAGVKALLSLWELRRSRAIAKWFKDPIKVPSAVFEGLGAVQESGQTNMQDHQAVQAVATRMGYPEVALWVGEHRHEYSEGVFRGFVAAE